MGAGDVKDAERYVYVGDTLGHRVHHLFRVSVHRAVEECDSDFCGPGGVLGPLFVQLDDPSRVLAPDQAVRGRDHRDRQPVQLVDGAQHVPHSSVDVQSLDADFYVFSGHKMLGPMGIGILYGKENLLNDMDPVLYGGSMIDDVNYYESTWAELPWKFEAGTQNIPAVIGLGAAIELLEEWGLDNIEAHDKFLTQYALTQLEQLDFVTVYGPRTNRNPVISFGIDGIHSHDVATFFDSKNVAIRSGHHCAKLIMKKLNVPATARASFYLYNTKKDVDVFIDAVNKARGYFAKWI